MTPGKEAIMKIEGERQGEQGLDLRYLRQGYLEEDYILDLGRVETTLLDLSY